MTLFIVAEGVDRAGKTTLLQEAKRILLEDGKQCEYYKVLKSDTMMGRLSTQFPSTYSLLGEVWYVDQRMVRPYLRKWRAADGTDDILLMDRWWYSVTAHHLLSRNEECFADAVIRTVTEPDILVHVTVSLEERLQRLQNDRSREHDALLKDPDRIIMYEARLKKEMESHTYLKSIDTTGKSPAQSAHALVRIIDEYRNIEKPCLA
jgi:thymidylate kinase